MLAIKLLIFVSAPGARGDFIIGWLGKLPEFIESFWSFEPSTGQSLASNQHVLELNNANDITNFLESKQYTLDPNARFTYATKVHSISSICKDSIDHNTVKIIQVDSYDADIKKILWEGIIKTNARFHRGAGEIPTWIIDRCINKSSITDIDRITTLDYLLRKASQTMTIKMVDPLLPAIKYNDLFKPQGSVFLADFLDISVDAVYHHYWNCMLPWADTPKEITLWGHNFQFKDYFIN